MGDGLDGYVVDVVDNFTIRLKIGWLLDFDAYFLAPEERYMFLDVAMPPKKDSEEKQLNNKIVEIMRDKHFKGFIGDIGLRRCLHTATKIFPILNGHDIALFKVMGLAVNCEFIIHALIFENGTKEIDDI